MTDDNKPTLTICIMSKVETCSETMGCFLACISDSKLRNTFKIAYAPCIGRSDISRSRSVQVSQWYKKMAKPGDYFMFIDADQTFTPEDILKCYSYAQKYEVAAGVYPTRNGGLASNPKDKVKFIRDGEGELLTAATGFFMMSYETVKKVAELIGEEVYISNENLDYPFFHEKIVVDKEVYGNGKVWVGEDFSFCLLVRQCGGKIYGFISPTIGHIVSETKAVARVTEHKDWPSNSIVYYCSSKEAWSPKSIEKGLGGSESAVVYLSREWAKRGYDVTVFCKCSEPGVYDGVHYRKLEEYNQFDQFNIVIIWRSPQYFVHGRPLAKKVYLDIHDHHLKAQHFENIVSRLDKIVGKSKFHIDELGSDVPSDKCVIIPNGGAYNFDEKPKKDPNYIIYTSFYNRGLPYILKWAWPKIKEACPDAYLKVFYGWDNLLKNNEDSEDFKLFRDTVEDLMKQDGVIHCGRVSHEEIKKEKAKANIHLYTGFWPEVDCISVRESASAGAIPIVSEEMKVFKEKPYCITVPGNPLTKPMQELAANKVIRLLKDPELTERARDAVLESKFETWEDVAQKWVELFEE